MKDTCTNTMSTTATEEYLRRKSTAASESDFDKYTVSTSTSHEFMGRNVSVDSAVKYSIVIITLNISLVSE